MKVSLFMSYTNQSDLKVLLNQTPNLYSLSIIFSAISTLEFFLETDIKNVSIRKLSLENIWWNRKQCVQLSRSSLGKQSEILTVEVQNKHYIIDFINEMIKLRSLTVKTYDNHIAGFSSPKQFYDLIPWLQFTLPSTIRIGRFYRCKNLIQLWIR